MDTLGEAASKCEHVRWALLRPEAASELLHVYLVRGALATTAIEGNTLSEEQALGVAEGTLRLPPSQEYLGREIENILAAFHAIRDEAFDHDGEPHADVPLTVEKIRRYNRMILDGLQVDEVSSLGSCGRTPSSSVRTVAPPPGTARRC